MSTWKGDKKKESYPKKSKLLPQQIELSHPLLDPLGDQILRPRQAPSFSVLEEMRSPNE